MNRHFAHGWTPAKRAQLMTWWLQGLSCQEMHARMPEHSAAAISTEICRMRNSGEWAVAFRNPELRVRA